MIETARFPLALRGGGESRSAGAWGEGQLRPLPAASGTPAALNDFAVDPPLGTAFIPPPLPARIYQHRAGDSKVARKETQAMDVCL